MPPEQPRTRLGVRHSLFLDANVLFTAAHHPGGKAAFLFEVASRPSPPWQLLCSAYAVEEARRNLVAKSPQGMADFEGLCALLTLVPQPTAAPAPLALPDKDQPIWSAALAARATHLLTGDIKDFGPHMNRPASTAGVVIQTVGDYLAALL
jgi:uncharacterized protein